MPNTYIFLLPTIIIYVPGFYGDVEIVFHVVRILGRQREEIIMSATSPGSHVKPGRRKRAWSTSPGSHVGPGKRKRAWPTSPGSVWGQGEEKEPGTQYWYM